MAKDGELELAPVKGLAAEREAASQAVVKKAWQKEAVAKRLPGD